MRRVRDPFTAASRLIEARWQMNYTSPCQIAPELWDAPDPRRETVAQAAIRILKLEQQCSQCKVFDLCELQRKEEDTQASGMMAGQMAYDPQIPVMNAKIFAIVEWRRANL